MKPILIIGAENSGKSRLAIDMAARSKSGAWYNGRLLLRTKRTVEYDLSHDLDWMTEDTKTIVFDDVLTSAIRDVLRFFSGPQVEVHRMMRPSIIIPTPQLIITSTCLLADLEFSEEERQTVTIFETSINSDNYLKVQIHEANRIEGVDPYCYMPRPKPDWAITQNS